MFYANINLTARINQATPLHVAVESRVSKCVEVLLEAGAECTFTSYKGGRSPLDLAAEYGLTEILQILCSNLQNSLKKEEAKFLESSSSLQLAARNGHVDCLKVLLDTVFVDTSSNHKNSSINFKNNLNTKVGTAVHEATLAGKSDCLLYLLDRGADFTIENKFEQTPLELVDKFVENRVPSNIQSYRYITNSCLQCRDILMFAEELQKHNLPMRA